MDCDHDDDDDEDSRGDGDGDTAEAAAAMITMMTMITAMVLQKKVFALGVRSGRCRMMVLMVLTASSSFSCSLSSSHAVPPLVVLLSHPLESRLKPWGPSLYGIAGLRQ